MQQLRRRIVSLVLALTMLLGAVPYSAFAAPASYVKTFSGTNTVVSITQSGDYQIEDGAAFRGDDTGSVNHPAISIGDNLEVTLWFCGGATIYGQPGRYTKDGLNLPASPGIYVGRNSTLTLRVVDEIGRAHV